MNNNRAAIVASNYGTFRKARETSAPHLLAMAGHEAWDMPDAGMYENQADLYRRLSWVLSAVERTAQTAAIQKLSIKKLKKQGEELEDIDNHEFELKLNSPNPLMSRFEFLVATFSFHALTGNAYWWLNKTSENATPAEIWVIPSYKIMPVPDNKLYLKGYVYDPGGGTEPFALETWEVVHFKRYNPMNEFVGMSPIEALAQVSVGDLEMQKYNTSLYKSNARIPGILAFADPINDLQWIKLQNQIDSQSAKRNYLMLRNVGKGGVEWLQSAIGHRDMEFILGRKFNKEEIYSVYAPGLASILDVNATEANAKAGKQTFLEMTIWPLLVDIAAKITNVLLPLYGVNLFAVFDDPRQVDRALELEEQRVFSMTHTVNEIRQEFYGDVEIGDDRGLLLPAQIGAAPVSMAVSRGEEQEIPPQLQLPPQEAPEEETTSEEEESPPEESEFEVEVAKWQRKALNAIKRSKPPAVEFESDVIPQSLNSAIIGALESAVSKDAVKRIFSDALAWNGYP